MDTRIYIATHKQFSPPQESGYIPLHVGHINHTDLGYTGDDTGSNISYKNSSHCELTGIYWMWKNVHCDIIGLCHYRRYFVDNGRLLTQHQIETILKTYDLIIGTSSMTPAQTIAKHYAGIHFQKDWYICRGALAELYPDYLNAFDLAANSNLMNLGNMMICRKELFDQYCTWLFPLLDIVEQHTDISNYDSFQARLYGYLAERLMRVWILMQDIRVHETTICKIET
mgnify:CR=1 FL=1